MVLYSEIYFAKDIDGLILQIGKNKNKLKSLIKTKNRLMRDIDNTMHAKAKKGHSLNELQILEYREFSEFYEAETAVLTLYVERLHRKSGKNVGGFAVAQKELGAIMILQERAAVVLEGMVGAAQHTLKTLDLK